MRLVLVLAALTLLSACNMVITQQPVFSKLDSFGAPHLRAGVWDRPPSEACAFDEKASMKSWPSCAQGAVAEPFKMSGWNENAGQKTWTSIDYILGWGHPQVLQAHLTSATGDPMPMPAFYMYVAINPTKLDNTGQIIEYESWPIMCGPPPPPDAKGPNGNPMRGGTLQPLPGLTMDASGNNCSTNSKAAIRGAAGPSRAWNKDITVNHWVRDGND